MLTATHTNDYDPVYTMPDWYDGPRRGIAGYRGQPYLYESTFSDIGLGCEDRFLLWKVSRHEFEIAIESWQIWQRWQHAFKIDTTDKSTHPALPEDRARYQELQALEIELGLEPSNDRQAGPNQTPVRSLPPCLQATAEFKACESNRRYTSILVRWTPIQRP